MRPASPIACAALVALLAAPALASAQEIDPFYLDLERAGRAALVRGDLRSAARQLRRACFGMLERPERLVACLVRLGIAQARGGERDAFVAGFERLDAVEERFGAYAKAPLEPAERGEFETRLGEWIEAARLEHRPAFAVLAARRAFGAADAAFARGAPREALAALEGIQVGVDGGRAWCMRGEAYARLDQCGQAASAFAACHPESETRFAAPALSCLLRTGRLDDARRLAAALPEPVRKDRAMRRSLGELEAAGKARAGGEGGAP